MSAMETRGARHVVPEEHQVVEEVEVFQREPRRLPRGLRRRPGGAPGECLGEPGQSGAAGGEWGRRPRIWSSVRWSDRPLSVFHDDREPTDGTGGGEERSVARQARRREARSSKAVQTVDVPDLTKPEEGRPPRA